MAKNTILTIIWLDSSCLVITLEPMNVGPIIRVMKALKERDLIKSYNISG